MRSPHHLIAVPTVAAIIAFAVTACGSGQSSDSGSDDRVDNGPTVKRPAIQTQSLSHPCKWVPKEEAAKVLGAIASADEDGSACVYQFTQANGEATRLSLEIDPSGAAEFEQAMGMLGNVFVTEMNDGKPTTAASAKRKDGWDFDDALDKMAVYRVGHVAVHLGGDMWHLRSDMLNQFAVLVRSHFPDLPIASPGADPNAAGPAPDPCALLSRAEAEAVLGKLLVEPFRSSENSALADGTGPTCTYYTPGHRALLVTPTRGEAKQMFDMVGGVSNLMRSTAGGADAAEALEGPWDQSSTSAARGTAYFLKGENMIEIEFRTSSTDLAGAAQLARLAVARL
jgi:hypothetical protein